MRAVGQEFRASALDPSCRTLKILGAQKAQSATLPAAGRSEPAPFLRDALRDDLARQHARIVHIFEMWDDNGDGTVSEREFRRAVRALGHTDASNDDVAAVFHLFDKDRSGSISREELQHTLKQFAGLAIEQAHALRKEAGGRKGAALSTTTRLDRDSGRPVPELLREALTANATRVIDLFRDWDENGDGRVTRAEFLRAMAPLGFENVTRDEAGALFDEFDPDRSGAIEFSELNKLLRRRAQVGVLTAAPSSPKRVGAVRRPLSARVVPPRDMPAAAQARREARWDVRTPARASLLDPQLTAKDRIRNDEEQFERQLQWALAKLAWGQEHKVPLAVAEAPIVRVLDNRVKQLRSVVGELEASITRLQFGERKLRTEAGMWQGQAHEAHAKVAALKRENAALRQELQLEKAKHAK